MLFLGIGLFLVGSTKEIVYTDIVEICQFYEYIHRIVQNSDFILGIGILADSQILTNLLLCITLVDPQIADILIFHYFIAHRITRKYHTIS